VGDLIELSCCHFPPSLIAKLIRSGYPRLADRHKPEAVEHAWDGFGENVSRMMISDGD
jgi:hypothetical protein